MDLKLTKREKEVASWFTLGKTHKEIAVILFLSVETVNDHRKNIYKKIGAHNVADMVRMYVSSLANIDVEKIVRDNLLEPNFKKIAMMFICLFLQIAAMTEGLDYRKTNTNARLIRVKAKKTGKKVVKIF